ncbi:conserved hypothetical protein [Histoplasma capsulatum var. duboisii H88]|uniref:Uncharacterized protein n=1 Tax=Ajellomyces capsulatus (strain H88) TaxID=544711 RepID=F0UCR8_AJEC8|nr:conserved hypothetical protein [Histoplasma capsulatum var. duboisii H88]
MKLLIIFGFLTLTAWALHPLSPQDQGDQTALTVNELAEGTNDDNFYGTNPVDGCWETLDCSLTEIEAMSMPSRLEFVKYMSTWRLDVLQSSDQFHIFEATIAFFMRKDIGTPGSWLSLVHAACVEALQRGAAMSLGISNNPAGNPAKQTAVDYGIRRADSSPYIDKPSARILRWMQFSRMYRTAMQYRRTILWLIKMGFSTTPSVPIAAEAFLDWVTDVTDATSTNFLAEMAWSLSSLGLSQDGVDPVADSEVMLKIITEFWGAFQLRRQDEGTAEECISLRK